jgi:hypothetical protein
MEQQLIKSIDEQMDNFQIVLSNFKPVECPLHHVFMKGVYIRQIFMPAKTIDENGEEVKTIVISKIHKTEHPYIITEGKVAVFNKENNFLGIIKAPYLDMTKPGTRRILHIIEDTRWMTIHRLDYITGDENCWNDKQKTELLKKIESDLIEEREVVCHS